MDNRSYILLSVVLIVLTVTSVVSFYAINDHLTNIEKATVRMEQRTRLLDKVLPYVP